MKNNKSPFWRNNGRLSYAARITLGYLTMAVAWILLSDRLVAIVVTDRDYLVRVQAWKGVAFVLVTGLVLYTLLRILSPSTAASPEVAKPERYRISLLLLAFVILASAILGFGYLGYRRQAEEFRNHQYRQQAAIAELKRGQIERWLAWHRQDAELLLSDPDLMGAVGLLAQGHAGRPTQNIRAHFEALVKAGKWVSIGFYTPDGRLLLQAGRADAADPQLKRAVADAAAANRIKINDIHAIDAAAAELRLDFLVPVVASPENGRPMAVVALRVDPRESLFRIVQSWPVSSATSEALLVRREGEDVAYITPPRHINSKPLEYRDPLSDQILPAARQGKDIYEGVDYRGSPVLAAFRPVAGMPWHVIAKTDTDEVMLPLEQQARLILIIVLLAIGATALFVAFLWRDQQARFAAWQSREREERQALVKHFEHLIKHARDIFLLVDPAGNVIEANDAAVAAYGYRHEELRQKSMRELYAPDARTTFEQDFQAADRPEGVLFESKQLRKDGSTFPVEVSSRVIDIQGSPYRQSFIRDIADRKRAEAAARQSEIRYRNLFEQMLEGFAYCRMLFDDGRPRDFTYLAVNAAFGRLTGLQDVIGKNVTEVIPGIRESNPELFEIYGRVALSGKPETFETYVGVLEIWFSISVYSPEKGFFVAVFDNITQRRRQEEELRRLNTIYAMLSETNGAIVRLHDPDALFRDICRITVEFGGYKGAWVGLVDAGTKRIVPAAAAGELDDCIRQITIGTDPSQPEGRGPTTVALLEDRPFYCNDFLEDAATAPWHDLGRKYGIRASVALPLHRGGVVTGVLTIYSGEPGVFDNRGEALLEEMAEDVSFALDNFDREAARHAAATRLQLQFDRMPFACMTVSTDLAIRDWNPAAEQIFGYRKDEVVGRKVIEVLVPDSARTGLDKLFSRLHESSQTLVAANENLTRDGRTILCEWHDTPLHDEKGTLVGILAMAQDITEKKRVEKQLLESEALFRSLVEQNVSAIFMIEDGRLAFTNSRTQEILGYDDREMLGKPILDLVAGEDRPAVARLMRQLMSGEIKTVEASFKGLHKNGTLVELGAHATRGKRHDKPFILGVAQDIGERKKAQQEIDRYIERLEHSMQSTLEAVSLMVELRDPYTAGHERRVGELAAAIGAEMGLADHVVKGLRLTGYVHDIGKISTPAELLSKPSRLTPMEFELIKAHPRSGYDVLKGVDFPWPVAEIILQHHERMDGSGYPQQLKGEQILLEARIMSVADVVEAMASHRPYRPGLGIDVALEEIAKNKGKLYDSDAADACLRLFREKGYVLPA